MTLDPLAPPSEGAQAAYLELVTDTTPDGLSILDLAYLQEFLDTAKINYQRLWDERADWEARANTRGVEFSTRALTKYQRQVIALTRAMQTVKQKLGVPTE